ncbi:MAG: Gmad2 immunoglobulin-like domain-containing protein [Acidimicrobiia bacterium]
MSRDPFEHMRDRNPVPPEDEPMAPAALAERIMGTRARTARRPMPGWAIATAAAAAVLAVGGVMMILTGPRTPVVGDGGTTTTAAAETTTTQPVVSFVETRAYFFAELDDGWVSGPFLISIAVRAEVRGDDGDVPGIAHQALTALFDGDVDGPVGFSSTIPEDAVYSGLEYDEVTGVVTVYVSAEFVGGGGSFSMMGRLAQVIYTATAVDGVTGVRFEVGGEPTTVFGGEGIVLDDPATREGFDDLLPLVFLDSPAYGATTGNPLVAYGKANTFEATLLLELTLLDGTVLWQGFTTATCGTGCWGDWQVEIPYELDAAQPGILYAYTDSMEDGSRITIRSHRVTLAPGEGPPVASPPVADCSGAEATTPLEDQDGLPAAVAETRAAIWAAARTCDWAALTDLAGDTLTWSFGGEPGDPTPQWKSIEATEQPTLYMAELLTMPYGTRQTPDGTMYSWPSAFGLPWAEVSAAIRAELGRIYEDSDFALWEEFGYGGYRVGIREDGTWMYFVGWD